MISRVSMLVTLLVLLTSALIGCNAGGSTADLEGTIVARVVATLQSSATTPAATQVPPEPTTTSVPEPTATSEPTATPEPTTTSVPQPTATSEPPATPAPPVPTVTPPVEIQAEEYAVYSALIQQNPIGFDLGSSILIREQTVSDLEMLERTLEERRPLPAQLVDSYRSRNAASYTLAPNLKVELDYALMPQEEFQSLLRRGGLTWEWFQEEYPEASGIVSFSRVGFGENEDEALVIMGYLCGDLCGAGGLYLLAKEEGGWKVQETLLTWIS